MRTETKNSPFSMKRPILRSRRYYSRSNVGGAVAVAGEKRE